MTQSGDPIRQCSSVAALVAVVCCCCCIIRCESTRKNKANKGKRQRKDRRQQQRPMRKVQRKFDRWQEEEEATQHKSQKSRESIPVSTSFFLFRFYVPIYETILVRGCYGDGDGDSRQRNFQAAFVLHHSIVVAMPRDTRGVLPDETKWKWKRNAKRGTRPRLGIGIGMARQASNTSSSAKCSSPLLIDSSRRSFYTLQIVCGLYSGVASVCKSNRSLHL